MLLQREWELTKPFSLQFKNLIYIIDMLASDFRSAQSLWQQERGDLGAAVGSPSRQGDELGRSLVEILSGQWVLPVGKVPPAVFARTCICSSPLSSTTVLARALGRTSATNKSFLGL